MKRLLAMLACVGLCLGLGFGTTGCGKGKDKDTHVKGGTNKPADTVKPGGKVVDTTLKLVPAQETVKVKQGGEAKVELTLTRGKDVTKDVDLSVDVPAKKGIEAEVAKSLGKDKTKTDLVIKVGDKAEVGDHKVTVTASSSGVTPSGSATVTVTVEKGAAEPAKDTELTVTGPEKAITVKQDGKETALVAVKLGKDLKGATLKVDVKDKDGKAAEDITATAAKVDKSGDAKVEIAVGPKAAPGDYVATVTATAEGATAATAKINIKIEKK